MTTKSKQLIVLFGPTGVGKTELLEKHFSRGYQVINADSKQIYRHLTIGSAKPPKEVLKNITHHLIDIKEPWENFSVGEFVPLADRACETIYDQHEIPLICGGTAYYIKHFYYGLPPSPPSNPSTRKKIRSLIEERGVEWAYQKLGEIDPISAAKIHISDTYRLSRALEVYEDTQRPLSSFLLPTTSRFDRAPLLIGLTRPKEELDKRIEQRVEQMFEQGLVYEIERLIALGAEEKWPAMKGIGYREFFSLKGASVDEIGALIIKNSKEYAKRQMTFFRSLPHVEWIHPDESEKIEKSVTHYLNG